VRLALLAAREEHAWRRLVSDLLERAVIEREPARVVVARSIFLGYPAALQARVVRALVRRLGGSLGESGTRAALEFTSAATSGRIHPLPGGLVLSREFDRLVLASAAEPEREGVLEIRGAGAGEGRFEMGGRRMAARWSLDAFRAERETEAFALARLEFPHRFRRRRPGDRIRLSYGSKKLKKLLSEAGIPLSERARVPVLVDGGERVLWLPGVARGAGVEPGPGEEVLHIGIRDEGRV
jgi:tRNA(Ile)-lysidine synthetase-like protein